MLRVSLENGCPPGTAPEELLDKLELAFVELGGQLLEPLVKAQQHHHGEVDVLEELYEGMTRAYELRLADLKRRLLAEHKKG